MYYGQLPPYNWGIIHLETYISTANIYQILDFLAFV